MIAINSQAPLLLLGATGRVGRLLQAAWRQQPPPVDVWTHGRGGNVDVLWDPLKGSNSDLVSALDRCQRVHDGHQLRPEVALVFLGVTSANDSAMSLNVDLARAVLSAADAAGIKRVLLASSAAVYGRPSGGMWSEDDPTNPLNDYGQAKKAMEQEAELWRGKGLDICCLRIGNVVGADMLFKNISENADATPLVLDRFSDGKGPVRSYLDAVMLTATLQFLANSPRPLPHVLNVAASQPVSMEDMILQVGRTFRWRDAPPSATQHATLDCTRLERFVPEGLLSADAKKMLRRTMRLWEVGNGTADL